MRIGIVSDIHGNRTAFDAVLRDLRETSPDLVLHGGDLAQAGPAAADLIDQLQDLGWPGVQGNTDELLWAPDRFEAFAAPLPQLESIWTATREMAAITREELGEHRLAWLRQLPMSLTHESLTLVHASPGDCWRSPGATAPEDELAQTYPSAALTVYGHIHHGFVRALPDGRLIANSGSVSLPYDGDPRAAYLLVDDHQPHLRRVAYDVEREVGRLRDAAFPRWEWIAAMLRSARPQSL